MDNSGRVGKPTGLSQAEPCGLGPSGFDPERGKLLAYGHAAYCAGWKAAVRCLANPMVAQNWHGRKWIEAHPPEAFTKPLIWRDGIPATARPEGIAQKEDGS